MNISLVPPDHVFTAWKEVREYLVPAVEVSNGRWTAEHLLAILHSGQSQLWVAHDEDRAWGALTTEIATYPAKRCLAMHFLGGVEFDKWYPQMLEAIESYATDAGCDSIEGVARFGFWPFLKNDGFKKTSAFYEKDI